MQNSEFVANYFEALNSKQVEKQIEYFTEEATVVDVDETFNGKAAIKEWIIDSNSKFEAISKVIDIKTSGSTINVLTTVSGNFPGSPVDLKYDFVMLNEKIKNLDIKL